AISGSIAMAPGRSYDHRMEALHTRDGEDRLGCRSRETTTATASPISLYTIQACGPSFAPLTEETRSSAGVGQAGNRCQRTTTVTVKPTSPFIKTAAGR